MRSWLMASIWLAYNGSDTLALYGLATLFNRHNRAPPADTASVLEILWAPVLLYHLGGPVTISAYNMEDNELWARHVLTLLSQVSVALYVLCKSWPPPPSGGDGLLLAATVLLFALGIIRLGIKPWALKSASINNLAPIVLVTYILLCSIAVMEVYQSSVTEIVSQVAQEYAQSKDMALVFEAQHNIISFALRRRRPTKPMALVGGDDLVNKYWHVGEQKSGFDILTVVLRQLEEGWKDYIHDAASFRRFNSFRGQWTLSKQGRRLLRGRPALAVLHGCLQQVPFDESVILWHIATNLCFHHPDAAASPPPPPPSSQEASMAATVSMHISDYMAYLLLLRPEMMMPGTRQDLFTSACYDLAYMLKYDDGPPLDERGLAQGIVRKARRFSWLFIADGLSPLLPEACRLAEALMEIGDEEARWKLIKGVWVEMLCHSASRCRGYLHAQSLGQGRELLSYVWLLLSHMGMETYATGSRGSRTPRRRHSCIIHTAGRP